MKVEFLGVHDQVLGTAMVEDGNLVTTGAGGAFLADRVVYSRTTPRRRLTPADGADYLEALPYAFRGAYVRAIVDNEKRPPEASRGR